ncbi:MAG TPA: transporter substrate-binding domain-containing protein [Usitatibacter sp.]|jgi:glutamate/aspartate transport system substrate-binding protein|nr:transporter substrate-binding domain-containing protein [Usitatibacter sp.]
MSLRNACAALVAAALLLPAAARAEEPAGTLKKVKDANLLVIGYRESSVPWSYLDSNQKVVGYSHEVALKIYDAIKADLQMPNLQLREIPITAQNRISLMQNGTIDLECNGTTNTSERRKQVAFSDTIAYTQTQLLTKKNSGIHEFEDIAGKTVAVTAGTTSERYLRHYADEKKVNLNIVPTRDHSQGFLMLQTGRADAFFMDRDVLGSLVAKAADKADYVITGKPQTKEALACMLRKDDPRFKALVDGVIAKMQTSGEAAKMYDKWFMAPIPPNGIVLNAPLTDAMRDLYAHPNDQSFD